MSKRWTILSPRENMSFRGPTSVGDFKEVGPLDIFGVLLTNRHLDEEQKKVFFSALQSSQQVAELAQVTAEALEKAAQMILETINHGGKIIIHGDYDVDGVVGAAILWEKIYFDLGYKNIIPFIPDRFADGYGLTEKSLAHLSASLSADEKSFLLITVDCGITALSAVEQAKAKGFQVLVIDHHTRGASLPAADSILWSDKLCAGGLAWLVSCQMSDARCQLGKDKLATGNWLLATDQLDLVALATIADLQPLTGANRLLVKAGLPAIAYGCRRWQAGLPAISRSGRVGLQALIKAAGLPPEKEIGPYEVGWILAPRLNAAGRLEDAMAALRLLVTRDPAQAAELAKKLSQTNAERQRLTLNMSEHARSQVMVEKKILVVSHEEYHEGVIGLVAGRLAQDFYRPAIVISRGEIYSKGSARSVNGFNIIEAIRTTEDLLVDAGGHPMAAGFTIETIKIAEFQQRLENYAESQLPQELLQAELKIDTELGLWEITPELFQKIAAFAPFGIGNPQPTFLTRGAMISDLRTVGGNNQHLKLRLNDSFTAVGFGLGEWAGKLKLGDKIDVVYTLEENRWNGKTSLELKLKDIGPQP